MVWGRRGGELGRGDHRRGGVDAAEGDRGRGQGGGERGRGEAIMAGVTAAGRGGRGGEERGGIYRRAA